MTTHTLAVNIVTALKAVITAPVEFLWRFEPPTKTSVYVQPSREYGERAKWLGNNFESGWSIMVIVETPVLANEVTMSAALDTVVEQVKAWVSPSAIREYVPGYVLYVGDISYQFPDRPGQAKPTYAAYIPLEFRPPE